MIERILVYGAGPLGSLMASRLHDAGQDVTILARGERLEQLREHGVVLQSGIDGPVKTVMVPVTDRLDPDDCYDLVLVVMRKNHVEPILPALSANANISTVLFLMNNFAGPQLFTRALGAGRVMIGFPLPGGERIGHIMRIVPVDKHHCYTIPIGETDATITERTREVASILGTMEGYKIQVRTDMDRWLKYHTALLMPAFAPALYACNTDIERLGRTRDALVLAARGIKEALRALVKSGIPLSPRILFIIFLIPEPILVGMLKKAAGKEKLKISGEGHARCARDELKHLADEFKEYLDTRGISTPIIDHMMKYFDPKAPLLPDGSRNIPLKKGTGAVLLALLCFTLLLILL